VGAGISGATGDASRNMLRCEDMREFRQYLKQCAGKHFMDSYRLWKGDKP
jgi:hypothetical protein